MLGSWSSVDGLVPTEKILDVFRDKSKRSKSTRIANVYVDGDADVETVAGDGT